MFYIFWKQNFEPFWKNNKKQQARDALFQNRLKYHLFGGGGGATRPFSTDGGAKKLFLPSSSV